MDEALTRLDELFIHPDEALTRMDELSIHVDELFIHMDELSIHMDKLFIQPVQEFCQAVERFCRAVKLLETISKILFSRFQLKHGFPIRDNFVHQLIQPFINDLP